MIWATIKESGTCTATPLLPDYPTVLTIKTEDHRLKAVGSFPSKDGSRAI